MKTMKRTNRVGKLGVLWAAVVGLASLANAEQITTSFPNGSFESGVVGSWQIATPESWGFFSGGTSSCWMGNQFVEGLPITAHEGNQVVYYKPDQYITDRMQVLETTVTSNKFAAGETSGTLRVSAWYQRWGTNTHPMVAYMWVHKNGSKLDPTTISSGSPPDTEWKQLLRDDFGETVVEVGDTLS